MGPRKVSQEVHKDSPARAMRSDLKMIQYAFTHGLSSLLSVFGGNKREGRRDMKKSEC